MANVTGRQWTLTTVDIGVIFPTPVLTGKLELDGVNESLKNAGGTNVKVGQFEWVGYTQATDVLTVTDTSGRLVWQADGKADLDTIRSGTVGWVRGGLILTAMTSGILLVYMANA